MGSLLLSFTIVLLYACIARKFSCHLTVVLLFCSKRGSFTIVPILVGALKPDKEAEYGQLLHKYLLDEQNLFVISSDFCHWGKRVKKENEWGVFWSYFGVSEIGRFL